MFVITRRNKPRPHLSVKAALRNCYFPDFGGESPCYKCLYLTANAFELLYKGCDFLKHALFLYQVLRKGTGSVRAYVQTLSNPFSFRIWCLTECGACPALG